MESDRHGSTAKLSEQDWLRLGELRQSFLQRDGTQEYWRGPHDLELYEATFAQRIAWKWRAALDEMRLKGYAPREGSVVDWGCGSGIAAREFMRAFPQESGGHFHFHDRNPHCEAFAAQRLSQAAPRARVTTGACPVAEAAEVVLVSHVLGELDAAQLDRLLDWVRGAAALVWVESGDRATSRALGGIRERLLDVFQVIAPCTHREACGALAPGNERNWCHFFTAPDPLVFKSAHWRSFSHELSIDLRSVPYSFLALCRPDRFDPAPGCTRVLGRPRLQKGRALLDGCDTTGLRERMLLARLSKEQFRTLERFDTRRLLYRWTESEGRIRSIETGPLGAEGTLPGPRDEA